MGFPDVQAQDRAYQFGLMGDTGYTTEDIEGFKGLLAAVNGADLSFVVHVGDFENDGRAYTRNPSVGPMPCTDESFNAVYDSFFFAVGPIIPGPAPATSSAHSNTATDPSFVDRAFVLAINNTGVTNFFDAMKDEESSIVYLLKKLRDDTTTLVRDEISLAKTEISEKIASTSRNVGYLAVGALGAYAALLLFLQGIGLLLRDLFISGGMNQASASLLGFLIVGGVIGIIGALLIVKALNTLKKEPLTPTKTAETLREDKEWVQNKVS
jgi:hypothetical protein